MCRLKSGIIFKNRCVVAPADNDSHSDLLRDLNIEDTYNNASRIFVRAELAPAKGEWWTDPDGWEYVVDQDVVPDWYDTDPGKYEEEFRQAVKAWWEEHVIVDKKIDELSSGYYRLKWCEVKRLLNDVKVYLDQSKVGEMWDSSQVGEMWESSRVGSMWDSSQVGEMWGSSQVGSMWDSSQVGEMRESSQVGSMRESSQVGSMRGSSRVGSMWDSSRVGSMWDSSQVGKICGSSQVGSMRGSSRVGEMLDSSQVGKMWGSSQVGKMRESSQVGSMWESSQVGSMRESSTVRDFKNWPNVKIHIPKNGEFELVKHEEESE